MTHCTKIISWPICTRLSWWYICTCIISCYVCTRILSWQIFIKISSWDICTIVYFSHVCSILYSWHIYSRMISWHFSTRILSWLIHARTRSWLFTSILLWSMCTRMISWHIWVLFQYWVYWFTKPHDTFTAKNAVLTRHQISLPVDIQVGFWIQAAIFKISIKHQLSYGSCEWCVYFTLDHAQSSRTLASGLPWIRLLLKCVPWQITQERWNSRAT